MRLLNVYTHEFHNFDLPDAPPYVIASHTWERDGEITLEEFRQGRGHKKSGYRKVVGFANYVKEHVPNVAWLWIDTCCIDQRDPQELNIAINSMFRWYLHAVVCLAYLSDVREAQDEKSFRESNWLKRGWTLQELHASRAVLFLTRQWQKIGHKADSAYRGEVLGLDTRPLLNVLVAAATGVPEIVLANFYRSRFLSVEGRLRWVERRQTTKPEDMSYSLLGIFDVQMATEYNIGKDEARRRLLAQIQQNNAALHRLPTTVGAAFDSRENDVVSQCLQNTRVQLLREIDEWASSANRECMFWLGGMAGTGKSTVLKTVAQAFEDQHRLAASFCFKRGEADRGSALQLITTISSQLAKRLPDVSAGVISALDMDPDIVRKSLREQFQKLILQPLQRFASPPVHGPAWIICIDALDECDREPDIGIVIDLLAKLAELNSANFRLFVTSRPDLPLRLGFGRMSKHAHFDVRLEDISKDIVTRDILIYLKHKLSEIRSAFADLNDTDVLGPDWPGKVALQALAQMAQPLFIFAATACRLLEDFDEDPRETLEYILQHRVDATQLERTYQPVLDRLLTNKETRRQQQQIIETFPLIVGSIITVAEPLTIPALARILEIPEAKIFARLQRLHSVLDVPSEKDRSKPVRPLHLSFRDYLTDIENRDKTPFWIDEAQQHQRLAQQCLRLLSSGALKEDVCDVKKPGVRRVEITKEQIKQAITSDVGYACRYWVHHMAQSKQQLHDDDPVYQFLRTHFLHWLEALAWLGRASDAIAYISALNSLVQEDQSARLLAYLEDARRFLLRNRSIIDIAPLQIYSSALVFSPSQSIVKQQFEDRIPKWLQLRPQVVLNWSTEVQKLEGHSSGVTAVAFAPDGKTVASGSWDGTVRLWNVVTRDHLRIIDAAKEVTHLAFSQDCRFIQTKIEEFETGILTLYPSQHLNGVGGVQLSDQWIRLKDQDVLWLPHEYRGICSAKSGNTLVVGQTLGAVSFFRIM